VPGKLKEGDELVRVDGRAVTEMTVAQATDIIMNGYQATQSSAAATPIKPVGQMTPPQGVKRHSFSKVNSILALYSKYTRPLSFENCNTRAISYLYVCLYVCMDFFENLSICNRHAGKPCGIGLTILDNPPHIVTYISPDGPAARSHAIEVGDTLVAINTEVCSRMLCVMCICMCI
jgi:C-terminal processing protease CtpA/Prc